MLEIPVQPQRPALPPPSQQASLPPRLQPLRPRPKQLVTVTVTDQNGGYVPGLQTNDFVVYEGDTRQEITYFNTGENEPISLGLIVDSSGSMRNKIGHARHALQRFIGSIKPQDEGFLVGFSAQPFVLQDFTDSRVLLAQGIGLLRPRGGTSLYDAILTGLRRMRQGKHRKKALIVMTDGMGYRQPVLPHANDCRLATCRRADLHDWDRQSASPLRDRWKRIHYRPIWRCRWWAG